LGFGDCRIIGDCLLFDERTVNARRGYLSHGFAVKPLWAEYALGAILVGAIMGITAIMNAYLVPTRILERRFAAEGLEMPEGYTEAYGFPISVLIMLAVGIVMTVIAKKTRFGRHQHPYADRQSLCPDGRTDSHRWCHRLGPFGVGRVILG